MSVDDGVARLRLDAAGACASTRARLERTVTEAVRDAAPELTSVEVAEAARRPVVIPVTSLLGRAGQRRERVVGG